MNGLLLLMLAGIVLIACGSYYIGRKRKIVGKPYKASRICQIEPSPHNDMFDAMRYAISGLNDSETLREVNARRGQ